MSTTSAADALGQAQILMLRKAMDMAVANNQSLLATLPGAPASGAGGRIDAYA